MNWSETISRAIDYIENNLTSDISIDDIAKQLYISSFYFQKGFSIVCGYSVGEYIRNRKLSLAAYELLHTDSKIIDIALKYGYDSPDSFTKAFTRFHGIAPKFARKKSAKLVLFNPLIIKITVEGGKSMDYRIVKTKEQKFIALARSFKNEIINDGDNHDIPGFWEECYNNNLIEPVRSLRPEGKRDLYGLCSPAKEGADTFEYGIGVLIDKDTQEFDSGEMEKAGYSIWDVKPGTYVVFDCTGEDGGCIGDTWSKFYKEFLPQMGYVPEAETDYEVYLEKGRKGLFCELWIPVRKK